MLEELLVSNKYKLNQYRQRVSYSAYMAKKILKSMGITQTLPSKGRERLIILTRGITVHLVREGNSYYFKESLLPLLPRLVKKSVVN